MIVELEKTTDSVNFDKNRKGCMNQSMLLPEPAINKGCYYVVSGGGMGQGRTFSMNPEERLRPH
jgi:hypothetical protein